ncbi:MAG: DUF2007 domain-containing protein [Rikenellaceae bacterium]|nr:DUF2007 domain-containing protein [Rikenellaceae bacterium]MBQ3535917.1 DUF2007 domain-containing protein [Alistipes sp.]MBQ8545170.1 DUF2007 domain-containing protein [Alistipes sp.]MBR3702378.1 DUF2007 domain-containing protein [Alistipes sp.]
MNMSEKNLIVIREYDSVNDAEWDKSILEGEGIWATIQNEIMSALYPTGVMPAQLVIQAKDKQRAEEVLEAYSS